MRNIPRFYTKKKLLPRQVLKYDSREPGPYQQLWHGGKLGPERAPQECIGEAKDKIQKQKQIPTPKKNIGKTDDPHGKYTKRR